MFQLGQRSRSIEMAYFQSINFFLVFRKRVISPIGWGFSAARHGSIEIFLVA